MSGTAYELGLPESLDEIIKRLRTADSLSPDRSGDFWFPVWGPGIDQEPGKSIVPRVYVRLGFTRERELVCTGLLVFGAAMRGGPVPIVTTRRARVPLAKILNAAALELGEHPRTAWARGLVEHYATSGSPPAFRVRQGPRGYPDEYYREVARRYRAALREHPRTPTKALIAEYQYFDEATVRRWLNVARERGFLGRSERGKPGEARRRRKGGKR